MEKNGVLEFMVKQGIPRTVEHFVAVNSMSNMTVSDLEGEELDEVLELIEEGRLSVMTAGSRMVQ